MALRISVADKNMLIGFRLEGNGGFDAGFTNDPKMDEYLLQEEKLDMDSRDVVEFNEESSMREELYHYEEPFDPGYYCSDWDFEDYYNHGDLVFIAPDTRITKQDKPMSELKTIGQIMAEHNAREGSHNG